MRQLVKIMLSVIIVVAAAGAQCADPGGQRVVGVKAYFVGWDIATRTRLSAEDIVQNRAIYIEIVTPSLAQKFAEWLRLSEMQTADPALAQEGRLVIKLERANGDTTVLYASRSRLYSADSSRFREIDSEFRSRFDLAR